MIAVILLSLCGLIVGSFLGLVSLRLPAKQDVVRGRSRCGGCGRTLAPWRIVPVVSWALSRGRCADCGSTIPIRYPLIEASAGLIGLWAGLTQPSLAAAGLTALLGWQLLLIAIVDGEHFWLPDTLTAPLFVTGLGATAVLMPEGLPNAAIGAVIGFGGLWLLARVYRWVRKREGLGGGDPFLLGAIGAWVGWIGLPSVLLWASAAGLSVVLAMILVRRQMSADDPLPFGVFLAIGAWLTWLYGPLAQ